MSRKSTVPAVHFEAVQRQILIIRGHKVLLDSDLALMYGVENKALLQAVRRNRLRFPEDFAFQLSPEEFASLKTFFASPNLKSQIVTSSWGGRRYPPYAFTEQGVAMLSSVLKSKRAISVNVEIMRAFVRLRNVLAGNSELARRLELLERKYDSQFKSVFDAIRELMKPPSPSTKRIGFKREEK